MTQPPIKRLLDDPSLCATLRADLRAASQRSPLPYDTAAGLVALKANLSAGGQGATAGAAGHASGGSAGLGGTTAAAATGAGAGKGAALGGLAVKWWGLAAVALAGASAAWLVPRDPTIPTRPPAAVGEAVGASAPESTDPPPVTRPPANMQPHAVDGPRATAPTSTQAASAAGRFEAASEPQPASTRRVRETRPPTASRAGRRAGEEAPSRRAAVRTSADAERASLPTPSSAPRSTNTSPAELAHLAALRRDLSAQPMRALRQAREGQRRFVDGMFVEERAAIAVFALAALDQRAEARVEAARFLRAFPDSPFAARVRRILAEAREGRP